MIGFIHDMYLHAPSESKGIFEKPESKSQVLPKSKKGKSIFVLRAVSN